MRIIFFFILLAASNVVFSQSADKKKKKEDKYQSGQPTSKDPFNSPMNYAPKRSKIKSKGITYDAEKNYYERMEMVEKARKKAEKEMTKPQYADPMYFGHKRPPKKHKAGKLKYCKECGIRH